MRPESKSVLLLCCCWLSVISASEKCPCEWMNSSWKLDWIRSSLAAGWIALGQRFNGSENLSTSHQAQANHTNRQHCTNHVVVVVHFENVPSSWLWHATHGHTLGQIEMGVVFAASSDEDSDAAMVQRYAPITNSAGDWQFSSALSKFGRGLTLELCVCGVHKVKIVHCKIWLRFIFALDSRFYCLSKNSIIFFCSYLITQWKEWIDFKWAEIVIDVHRPIKCLIQKHLNWFLVFYCFNTDVRWIFLPHGGISCKITNFCGYLPYFVTFIEKYMFIKV